MSYNSSHPGQKKTKAELERKTTETVLEIMSLVLRNYAIMLCTCKLCVKDILPVKLAVSGKYVV